MPNLQKMTSFFFLTILLLARITVAYGAFGSDGDRILLKDISALTLYKDKMTTGRRSPPVPQLKCVGGTAYGYFTPDVVQCYNRGFDGNDIQWECHSEMEKDYKLGRLDVMCEGYNYPNDPYVLRGSCGLEYEIEFTKEGEMHHNQQQGHSYSYSYGANSHSSNYDTEFGKKAGSAFGHLLFIGGTALVIYIVYKTCLASNGTGTDSGDSHRSRFRGGNQPPPYGFRPEYMPGQDSCHSTYTDASGSSNAGAATGGGFWTGAATGGLLGYLFGRNTGYTQYHQPYTYSSPWSAPRPRSFFGGSSSGSGGSFGSSGYSSGSSGTHTSTGFGGTKRR